jgi:hypothetical protein
MQHYTIFFITLINDAGPMNVKLPVDIFTV